MEKYNYFEVTKEGVKDFIAMSGITDSKKLLDKLFARNDITGNVSGSFYGNRWDAEVALAHNFDLLCAALQEYDVPFEDDPEKIDVAIRCFILPEVIDSVLAEMEE